MIAGLEMIKDGPILMIVNGGMTGQKNNRKIKTIKIGGIMIIGIQKIIMMIGINGMILQTLIIMIITTIQMIKVMTKLIKPRHRHNHHLSHQPHPHHQLRL